MSGVLALLHLGGAPIDTRLLSRLTATMRFRGPSAQLTRADGPIGFGQALLDPPGRGAVSDRQPARDDLWLSADLRLDDRERLRLALEAAGRRPASQATDTDLLLAAYDAWGNDSPSRLTGDFAYALWDRQRRQLLCARSMFGVKPLYYARLGELLLVGNTLETLRAHPGMPASLDEGYLADFLLFGTGSEAGATVWSAIRRLPAGHRLIAAGGNLDVQPCWELRPDDEPTGPKDRERRLRQLLAAAVEDRLGGARVSVVMSGGMDSTTVAVTAKTLVARATPAGELRGQTVSATSLWPEDEEGRLARLVGESAGFPVDLVEVEKGDLLASPDRLPSTPEPLHEPLFARSVRQYRRLSAFGRVALTGYGGDSAFRPESGRLSPAPEGAWRHWLAVLRFAAQHRRPPPLGLRRRLGGQPHTGLRPSSLPPWFSDAFAKRIGAFDRLRQSSDLLDVPAGFRPTAYRDVLSAIWPATFAPLDAEVTRQPLEFRHPFFDLRLLRFLLALPSVPWCIGKDLLRRSMRARLPEPIRDRRKTTPGSAPIHRALLAQSPQWWRRRLSRAEHLEPYVDLPSLSRLVAERRRLRMHEYPLLTRPLCLAHWLSKTG